MCASVCVREYALSAPAFISSALINKMLRIIIIGGRFFVTEDNIPLELNLPVQA